MKNPLRSRFHRDLKSNFGKYAVIFLFMGLLVSLVSGYLVAADSVKTVFYEAHEKYNLEDGHIVFSRKLPKEVRETIEGKDHLKLYNEIYAEEDIDKQGTTLRIYKNRDEVNRECIHEGRLPEKKNEIAVNRLFAVNNELSIGDKVTLNKKEYEITGLVSFVDYGCMFENESDMMFNAKNFGVAVVTDAGFKRLESAHKSYCYAWKYNNQAKDEAVLDKRSEDLKDDLEDIIKEYDTAIIQADVDRLYDRAEELSDVLESEFEKASSAITKKSNKAAKQVAKDAMKGLTDEEKYILYQKHAKPEAYLKAYAKKKHTTVENLVFKKMGTSRKNVKDLEKSIKTVKNLDDGSQIPTERPTVNLDDVEDGYEHDTDFSLDSIWDVANKLHDTGLYNCGTIYSALNELEEMKHYEFDENKLLMVDGYSTSYNSKAVNYCMDDMKSDRPMFIAFDYIVTLILAFMFAVTTSNTIAEEASVIGTLRALGYTRRELLRHYLAMPMVVSAFGAIVGNVLGYTVLKNMMKGVFYSNFSLPVYRTIFNYEAFMITTVIPLAIMLVINVVVLSSKLRLSPMKFLRRDLKRRRSKGAVPLSRHIPIMHRFRTRILMQNTPAYLTMAAGIVCGGVIMVFGLMFMPLLRDYSALIQESKIAEYQYVLKEEVDTEVEGAEKYCITSLDIQKDGYMKDEISVFGVSDKSNYITKDIPKGKVLITEGMMKKYGIRAGDKLTLKEAYKDKSYDFIVAGTYKYDAALSIFMNRKEYNKTFKEDADYFSGYFSDRELTDIDSDDIATTITTSDLVKVSTQLEQSFGSFMYLFQFFGTAMFLLLMYLMTKQIIEKNMQSIAMTKILGFRNTEISRLYLVSTSIVVIASLLASVPLIDKLLKFCFDDFLYKEITGYIPYIVDSSCYVKEFVIGIICYVMVCLLMMVKISRVEKNEVLKNVE